MDRIEGEDLGHGVRVVPSAGGEVIVVSRRLDLGLRMHAGAMPGTAVLWQEDAFEVVGSERCDAGFRWTLRPWCEATAMRTVLTLDKATIAALGVREDAERRSRRTRWFTLVLLPVLGLAPARLQRQWRDHWAFPASAATFLSAFAEFLFGTLGTLQMAFVVFDGKPFLPSWLGWLQIAGPPLAVFGIVRMAQVVGNGQPVGSPLGLPLAVLDRPKPTDGEKTRPEVSQFDEEGGVLEVTSPVHRSDWDREGALIFRGSGYRLDSVRREGTNWVYSFAGPVDVAIGDRELRFLPLEGRAFAESSPAGPPPSILGTTLVTACVTLGPREDQERWAKHTGIRPIWFTLVGAGAELVGGFVNLASDSERGVPLLLILDLFVFGEGLLRVAGVVLSGRPVGSVFGWFLRPLYRGRLPAEKTTTI